MRVALETGGRFDAPLVGHLAELKRATRAGIEIAVRGLKDELGQQIQAAGLGEKLGHAVDVKIYPASEKGSLDAAGVVQPHGRKAEHIFEAFNTGATIRGKSGNWLAIPTRNAYLGGRGGHRPTPAEFEQQTGIKLRVAAPRNSTKGRYQFLVGDAVAGRRAGTVRGATRRRVAQGRAVTTQVYFILIRQARMRRSLSFDALAAKWAERIPDYIDQLMPGEL